MDDARNRCDGPDPVVSAPKVSFDFDPLFFLFKFARPSVFTMAATALRALGKSHSSLFAAASLTGGVTYASWSPAVSCEEKPSNHRPSNLRNRVSADVCPASYTCCVVKSN
jgi:hypothetical protein